MGAVFISAWGIAPGILGQKNFISAESAIHLRAR